MSSLAAGDRERFRVLLGRQRRLESRAHEVEPDAHAAQRVVRESHDTGERELPAEGGQNLARPVQIEEDLAARACRHLHGDLARLADQREGAGGRQRVDWRGYRWGRPFR